MAANDTQHVYWLGTTVTLEVYPEKLINGVPTPTDPTSISCVVRQPDGTYISAGSATQHENYVDAEGVVHPIAFTFEFDPTLRGRHLFIVTAIADGHVVDVRTFHVKTP